jgi:predicted  nucleic acid-binding Zn-ribbon protein
MKIFGKNGMVSNAVDLWLVPEEIKQKKRELDSIMKQSFAADYEARVAEVEALRNKVADLKQRIIHILDNFDVVAWNETSFEFGSVTALYREKRRQLEDAHAEYVSKKLYTASLQEDINNLEEKLVRKREQLSANMKH